VGAPYDARSLIDRFPNIRIVVIGDAVLDEWMYGSAQRLCRDAPVPVVEVRGDEPAPGAAANTAANVANLGGNVALISRVGTDAAGAELRTVLRHRGVADDLVLTDDVSTPSKHRLVCDENVVARYDRGSPSTPPPELVRRLIAALHDAAKGAHAVLVCDYGYQLIGPDLVAALAGVCQASNIPLVVDAHDFRSWTDFSPTAVLPNATEAAHLLSLDAPTTRAALLDTYGPQLLDRSGADMVVVTLDRDGAVLHRRGYTPYRAYATPVPVSQTTGAGDTFAAAFTLSLASGAAADVALDVAQAAASVAVRSIGTTICTKHDLVRQLNGDGGPFLAAEQLARNIDRERANGRRIVFTNGCFDVLHRGHVAYLQQARQLGDTLIVAVNSDSSVSRLKGPGRPVNCVEDRVAVLSALSCVDYVTVFDEDTPVRLLELVRPDLYVKGGDYTANMLPETPIVERLGGRVRILDYVEERSTTALIDRIRASAVD
jgi:D-beta-D-heptose 7-phosphate kinase / D-beta-D-heptose 1-phosphate adenosyltransferase